MVTFCHCEYENYIGEFLPWPSPAGKILACRNCGQWVSENDVLRPEKLALAYRQERIDNIYSYCTCGPIPTKGPKIRGEIRHEQCDHNCGCLLHGVNNGGII